MPLYDGKLCFAFRWLRCPDPTEAALAGGATLRRNVDARSLARTAGHACAPRSPSRAPEVVRRRHRASWAQPADATVTSIERTTARFAPTGAEPGYKDIADTNFPRSRR